VDFLLARLASNQALHVRTEELRGFVA